MKRNILLFILAALLIPGCDLLPSLFGLSFIGQWKTDDSSFRFEFFAGAYFEQKTVTDNFYYDAGNYAFDGSRLYLEYGNGKHVEYFYEFKDYSNTLILTTTQTIGVQIILERTTDDSIGKPDIIGSWETPFCPYYQVDPSGRMCEGLVLALYDDGTFKKAIISNDGNENTFEYYTGTFDYDFYEITFTYEDERQETTSYLFTYAYFPSAGEILFIWDHSLVRNGGELWSGSSISE